MTDFSTLKRMQKDKMRERMGIDKNIKESRRELEDIDFQLRSLQHDVHNAIERERHRVVTEAQRELVEPLERDLVLKEQQLVKLRGSYRIKRAQLNPEEVYSELVNADPILPQVKAASEQVLARVSETVGERFAKTYMSQLSNYDVKIDPSQLPALLKEFEEVKDQLKDSPSKRLAMLDRVEDLLNSSTKGKIESDGKGAAVYAGVLTIGFLATIWVTGPLYLTFLVSRGVSNMRKGLVYSQTLIKYKAVMDNLNTFEEEFKRKAQEQFEQDIKKVEEEFKVQEDKLLAEITSAESSLLVAKTRDMDSFPFDTSHIQRQADEQEELLRRQQENLEDSIVKDTERFDALTTELRSLQEQIKQSIADLKSKYLDFDNIDKDNYLLITDFLVDIVDEKPVMFDYPADTACVFLYDDIQSVHDFIKLFIVQLRARMNPFAWRVQLWDVDTMGINYASMINKEKAMVEITSESALIPEKLSTLRDLVQKRNELVSDQFPNLTAYNQAMLDIDSLAEAYTFLFAVAYPTSVVSTEVFSQLVRVGPRVGVHPNLFIQNSALTEDYKDLLDSDVTVYTIVNGKISTKARDFLVENLQQFRN